MADPTLTLQRELLDQVEVWPDVEAAQAAIDAFRVEYNTDRPHQSLGMAFPADRFVPRAPQERLALHLPAALGEMTTESPPMPPTEPEIALEPAAAVSMSLTSRRDVEQVGLAVEVARIVPASGISRCAGSSSGSVLPVPASRSRSGWTPRWCTCSSMVSGSRPCRPGSPPPT